MSVQDLITQIYENIPMANFEMEYNYQIDNNNIDLRLYTAGKQGAITIRDIILDFDFTGVIGATVETPSPSEIEAFSGYKFHRVLIEVDCNVARGNNDNFLFNDSGRVI